MSIIISVQNSLKWFHTTPQADRGQLWKKRASLQRTGHKKCVHQWFECWVVLFSWPVILSFIGEVFFSAVEILKMEEVLLYSACCEGVCPHIPSNWATKLNYPRLLVGTCSGGSDGRVAAMVTFVAYTVGLFLSLSVIEWLWSCYAQVLCSLAKLMGQMYSLVSSVFKELFEPSLW